MDKQQNTKVKNIEIILNNDISLEFDFAMCHGSYCFC
jgi:hypothetical protein